MLQVMVVSRHPERRALLESALQRSGYIASIFDEEAQMLSAYKKQLAADALIIDMESAADCLQVVKLINQEQAIPIVIFTEQDDAKVAREAIRIGVNAYVVDGLQSHRIRPILDAAVERFNQFQSLRNELEKTKNSLAERKVVEKAKGILMKEHGCSEEEAYHSLRKLAMKSNKRLVEIAEAMIIATDILANKE